MYSFEPYENSILQRTLLNLLELTQETKRRFPTLEIEDSPEAVRVVHMLKAVELVVSFLNRSILPLLSQGRSLNSFDILGLILPTQSLHYRLKELLATKDPKRLFLKSLARYLMNKYLNKEKPSSLEPAVSPNQDDIRKQMHLLIDELHQEKDALFSFDKTLSQEKRTQIFDASICHINSILDLNLNELKHTTLISLVLENLGIESIPKHLAFYFFIGRISLLMIDIPRDLKSLASFFNPESIPISIHNTLLGSMLPLEGRRLILTDAENFCYEIKQNEVIEKEIHASKLYQIGYEEFFSYLRCVRRRYLALAFNDTTLKNSEITLSLMHIESSEQAKKQLLLSFVENQKRAISACFRGLNLEKWRDEGDIQIILNKLKLLKQRQLYLERFIDQLALLKQTYVKNTVLELFKKHSDLYQQCQCDADRGLNVDYLFDLLPNEISDCTHGHLAMRGKNLSINKGLQDYVAQFMLDALSEIEKINIEIKTHQILILSQWRINKAYQAYQKMQSKITLNIRENAKISACEDIENGWSACVASKTKMGQLYQALENIGTQLLLQTTNRWYVVEKSSQTLLMKEPVKCSHLNRGNTRWSMFSSAFFYRPAIKQQRENIELLSDFNVKDNGQQYLACMKYD